jgi:hypothetical protein
MDGASGVGPPLQKKAEGGKTTFCRRENGACGRDAFGELERD